MPFNEVGAIPEPFAGDGRLGGRLYTELRSAKFTATTNATPGEGWILKPDGTAQFDSVVATAFVVESEFMRTTFDSEITFEPYAYDTGDGTDLYEPASGTTFIAPDLYSRKEFGIDYIYTRLTSGRNSLSSMRETYLELYFDPGGTLHTAGQTGAFLGSYFGGGKVQIGNVGDDVYLGAGVIAGYGVGDPVFLALETSTGDTLVFEDIGGGDIRIRNDQQDNAIIFFDGTGGVRVNYNGSQHSSFESNQLLIPSGVYAGSSSPGLAFVDDPDTGLRRSTSGGSDILVLDAGGNAVAVCDSGTPSFRPSSSDSPSLGESATTFRWNGLYLDNDVDIDATTPLVKLDGTTGPFGLRFLEGGTHVGGIYYRTTPNTIGLEDSSGNAFWEADTDNINLTIGTGTGADNLNVDARDWNWTNIYWVNDSAKGSLRTTNASGTQGASGRIYQHSSSIKIKSDLERISPAESVDKVKRLSKATATYLSPIPDVEFWDIVDKEGRTHLKVIDNGVVDKRSIGFIAEEVQKIEPLTTAEPDEEGYVPTMSEDGIIVHLTVALADALERIETLEERLTRLEAQCLS